MMQIFSVEGVLSGPNVLPVCLFYHKRTLPGVRASLSSRALQDCTPESARRHLRWSKRLVPPLSEQSPLYPAVRSPHPGATVPHSLQLSAMGELVRTGQQSSHLRSRASPIATMRFLKIRCKTRLSMSWLQECLTVGRTLPSWVTSLWEQGTRALLSLHPKYWSYKLYKKQLLTTYPSGLHFDDI